MCLQSLMKFHHCLFKILRKNQNVVDKELKKKKLFTELTCRNLSVKICIDQSNKVKTSDKQMHVAFCDNSFYCKISSDKLKRRSDKLIHVRSVGP